MTSLKETEIKILLDLLLGMLMLDVRSHAHLSYQAWPNCVCKHANCEN